MSFSVFKVKISISVPFAVIIAFLLITDKTGLMSASLFAVVIHEMGHLVAMKAVKCAPKEVVFSAAGVLINGAAFCSATENVIIAVSGPVTNLIFTVLFYFAGVFFDTVLLVVFAAVQLILGVINLLPIKGLDGGTVLYFLLQKFGANNPNFALTLVSIFTAVAVTVLGAAVAVKNISNPSLLLLGIYLIILNVMKS